MSEGKPGRIYVYSAPGYDTEWTRTTGATSITGRGRYKVGYTGRPDPRVRVKEQTGTVYPEVVHFPGGEQSTYTAASVVLAADALGDCSPAASLFVDHDATLPLLSTPR